MDVVFTQVLSEASALCSVVSARSQVILSFQTLILVKMILLKAVRLDQDLMVWFLALSSGHQHRSQNKASVTDQSGPQELAEDISTRTKEKWTVLSCLFYFLST